MSSPGAPPERRSRVSAGLALLAVAGFVAAAAVPMMAAPGTGAAAIPAEHNPHGRFLGVVPSVSGAPPAAPHASGPNATGPHASAPTGAIAHPNDNSPVTYHGGPVQHSSNVYAIFWKPAAFTIPAGYAATVVKYFTDVAHDSYHAANPYGSDTQYYDMAGTVKNFVSYAVTYKSVFVDTKAYPANGCPNYELDDGTMSKRCFTDTQLVNEIKSVVAAHALPKGIANEYFLFTPQGVASCFAALAAGGCYDPFSYAGFCAYHSFSGTGAQAVLYANMAYADVTGCASGQSPENNAAADSTINVVSHEHQETITDPLGTAWYDVNGDEIADKCIFTFGAALGTNSFGQYNEVINTHDYWLQEVWSNRATACVQRNTYPQPTASFTFTPTAPAHGATVTFHSTSHSGDGTALKFHWSFPNGTVSTVANPTFKFAAVGTYSVSLLVYDTHGDQARITHPVTVH